MKIDLSGGGLKVEIPGKTYTRSKTSMDALSKNPKTRENQLLSGLVAAKLKPDADRWQVHVDPVSLAVSVREYRNPGDYDPGEWWK